MATTLHSKPSFVFNIYASNQHNPSIYSSLQCAYPNYRLWSLKQSIQVKDRKDKDKDKEICRWEQTGKHNRAWWGSLQIVSVFSQAVAFSLSFAQYFHGVENIGIHPKSQEWESIGYTLILKVRARMKPQPNTEIIPMLERIAIGPLISAPFVSSVKCAAESYPKREYWLTSHDISTP